MASFGPERMARQWLCVKNAVALRGAALALRGSRRRIKLNAQRTTRFFLRRKESNNVVPLQTLRSHHIRITALR